MRFHLKGTTSISQATYNLNYNVDHAGFVKNIYSELSSSTLFVVKQNLNTSAIYLSANMDRMYKTNITNNKKNGIPMQRARLQVQSNDCKKFGNGESTVHLNFVFKIKGTNHLFTWPDN